MNAVVGNLLFWLLIITAGVCVIVAVIAVLDWLRGGAEDYAEFQEWLRARDVTGRT